MATVIKLERRIKQLTQLLREAEDNLIWCSGSADFNEGGQARLGWKLGPQKTLRKIRRALAKETLG